MTPAEKLDRSRLAIIEYLERREHRGEPSADDGSPAGDDGDGGGHFFSGDGWLGGGKSVV